MDAHEELAAQLAGLQHGAGMACTTDNQCLVFQEHGKEGGDEP